MKTSVVERKLSHVLIGMLVGGDWYKEFRVDTNDKNEMNPLTLASALNDIAITYSNIYKKRSVNKFVNDLRPLVQHAIDNVGYQNDFNGSLDRKIGHNSFVDISIESFEDEEATRRHAALSNNVHTSITGGWL